MLTRCTLPAAWGRGSVVASRTATIGLAPVHASCLAVRHHRLGHVVAVQRRRRIALTEVAEEERRPAPEIEHGRARRQIGRHARGEERPEGVVEALRVRGDHALQQVVVRCAAERLVCRHQVWPARCVACESEVHRLTSCLEGGLRTVPIIARPVCCSAWVPRADEQQGRLPDAAPDHGPLRMRVAERRGFGSGHAEDQQACFGRPLAVVTDPLAREDLVSSRAHVGFETRVTRPILIGGQSGPSRDCGPSRKPSGDDPLPPTSVSRTG